MSHFPHYFQVEQSDCGPTCLKIILQYYGKSCDLKYLRNLCDPTRAGVSMLDLVEAASQLSLKSTVLRATEAGLRMSAVLPCILHWKQDHFVVLYRISKRHFYISDPTYGKIRIDKESFNQYWKQDNDKGVLLTFSTTEDFRERQFPRTAFATTLGKTLGFYRRALRDQYRFLWVLIISLMAGSVIAYVFPQLMKKMVDSGVQGKNLSVLWTMLWFQVVLIISGSIFNFIRDWVRVELSMKVSRRMITDLLLKVVRLPVSFFDNGVPSSLYQRIEDQRRIEKFLSEEWVQAVFSLVLILLLSIQLFLFNVWVGLVFTFFTLLSLGWFLLFYRHRSQLDYSSFHTSAENHLLVNEMIAGMLEIKVNAAQQQKVKQWEALQTRIYGIKKRGLYLHAYEQSGVQVLTQLKNVGMNFLCAYWVIHQSMTIGTMLSVGYIIALISGSIDRLMIFLQSLQQSQLSFQRLDEIWQREDEVSINKSIPTGTLAHGFRFDNVSFRFAGAQQRNVLKNISFAIPAGKVTAIVGTSGSGKTSLLKLLLAFYQPQQGTIFLGLEPLQELDNNAWRKRCGVVMQDGYIFSGTIAENISLAEGSPDDARLMKALHIACLAPFVESLPMGYHTKIGKTGLELSGGEKQRILIARAVFKDPQYLFFDEATSSLDARTERQIMENLQAFYRGKTVVVIAHRLSTVRNADQIIVLEKGQIAGIGDHESLTREKGRYFELVRNQLELGQ
ncbi:peptidase domain-containing ABC transporter [Paraflavitalea sp. CAU 1676]|uniref:peptidase domain-containing ABC transporter n=1 Tax=Paraflavitalea sp. CAU 1676 TaxID=3032598 RepID=UPI0023DC60E5|nr:peptidase domain-containing ABC transporter [Paraflavitalea sp. CAU 1676]MDF2192586.1 peptidase domain-containing ABC transporter [Paraflavitalea sp. CAU 1676]